MTFQDLVSLVTLGFLLLLVVLLLFLLRAVRHPFGKMPPLPTLEDSRAMRNALLDAPGPERTGREVLPLSSVSGGSCKVSVYDPDKGTFRACGGIGPDGQPSEDPNGDGVNLQKGKLYRIVARPQRVAFRPERFVIGRNADDWYVHDIKVGNRSQFSQSGAIPGSAFRNDATDCFVSFETLQTAMDLQIDVTYVGDLLSSPFVAAAIGTAAV